MTMKNHVEVQPAALVIFGGGGDLTWRKLVPALYNLFLEDLLPRHFTLTGLDRKEMSQDEFRQRLRDGVDRFSRRGQTNDDQWQSFADALSYISADFDDNET
jgi:glucose-6-phosphate 1-dehydrogenase